VLVFTERFICDAFSDCSFNFLFRYLEELIGKVFHCYKLSYT